MKYRQFLVAFAAVACLSTAARAQQASSPDLQAGADTAGTLSTGAQTSLIDRPSEAVRRPTANAAAMPLPATSTSESKAMMVVGAAAFVAGALIDGDAGTVLMVGGAVVGLYGLWNYLR
ncbi:MAG TPA: hypothetical protein VFO55_01835 [Gemmatimonadaceae bacterium]|nr:hypothetical protein [Gemmatimonadaceae bacterium]